MICKLSVFCPGRISTRSAQHLFSFSLRAFVHRALQIQHCDLSGLIAKRQFFQFPASDLTDISQGGFDLRLKTGFAGNQGCII